MKMWAWVCLSLKDLTLKYECQITLYFYQSTEVKSVVDGGKENGKLSGQVG